MRWQMGSRWSRDYTRKGERCMRKTKDAYDKQREQLEKDRFSYAAENMVLICADLSLRRPGFAVQQYHAQERRVEVLEKSNVDNKTHTSGKCHGQILSEIAHELRRYLEAYPQAILIREAALVTAVLGTVKTVAILHKVVGLSDLYAWGFGNREFCEILPASVKAIVALANDASKEEVAKALEQYVGKQDYACDDESDAVAVGVAWLIQNHYQEYANYQKKNKKKKEED